MQPRILVTGALGQIGTELVIALRGRYGCQNVVATDLHPAGEKLLEIGPYERLDVMDRAALQHLVQEYGISQIYHLVAMLSAKGEQDPALAWELNVQSLMNVLEVARDYQMEKVFWPSSIAVFGPDARKHDCPQHAPLNPTTIYGISKVAGEQLCNYYKKHFGLDIRSLRYPGLISHSAPPGGGTTDYAVAIFYEALKTGSYTCFLRQDTRLPMLYMEDACAATLKLMEAPRANLWYTAYNLGGMDFTPAELATELKNYLPGLTVNYRPDSRQQIADGWPDTINDTPARQDWGWHPQWSLDTMVADMLQHIQSKQATQSQQIA